MWLGSVLAAQLLMMANDLIDDEAQELLGEIRVQLGILRQLPQPRDLIGFPVWIGRGKGSVRLILTDSFGDLEALGQHEDKRGINIVDAVAIAAERFIHPGCFPWVLRPGSRGGEAASIVKFARHHSSLWLHKASQIAQL